MQYLKAYTHDSNRTSPNIDIYWYPDTQKYIVQAENKKKYICFLWKEGQNNLKTTLKVRGNIFVILGLCRLSSPEKLLVAFISSKSRLVPSSGGWLVAQFVGCVLSDPTVLCERPEVSQVGLLRVTTSLNYRL